MKRTLRLLDAVKAKLDALRPFPAAVTKNLHENLMLNWTYHSNAIEGNTLTLKETKVVFEGITKTGYRAQHAAFCILSDSCPTHTKEI